MSAIDTNLEGSVMTDLKKSKKQTQKSGRPSSKGRSTRKLAIDFHAHIIFPEATKFSSKHVVSMKPPKEVLSNPVLLKRSKKWQEKMERRFTAVKSRLRDMNEAGIDVQVLTSSLVHHYTYWAEPEKSLKMEQLMNDRIAEIVDANPSRFIGLGGVPLQHTAKAVKELERCVNVLGLHGIQISSTAGSRELGDRGLFPFWKKAEELGTLIYIHPAGITDRRYKRFDLWNSIGQPLEEAMAMASLFYEGVLDRFPKLKICIAHGGGYLPFYTGRVDRNYRDKPHLRFNMSKSPSQYLRHFYYDSCVYNMDMLEFLVKKVGAGRIILGSDYPVGEDDPVGFVRRSRKISPEDKEKIIWKNAARLLKISA